MPTPMPTAASCEDGTLDGDETDVDCGGGNCARCDVGQICTIDDDCHSLTCMDSTCVASPTPVPIPTPTAVPIPAPTVVPIPAPTSVPFPAPTFVPIPAPTAVPIPAQTAAPTGTPGTDEKEKTGIPMLVWIAIAVCVVVFLGVVGGALMMMGGGGGGGASNKPAAGVVITVAPTAASFELGQEGAAAAPLAGPAAAPVPAAPAPTEPVAEAGVGITVAPTATSFELGQEGDENSGTATPPVGFWFCFVVRGWE